MDLNDPQYKLFMETHYKTEEIISFRPTWSGDRMMFPKHIQVTRKDVNLAAKLKYYYQDFRLYLKMRRERNGQM